MWCLKLHVGFTCAGNHVFNPKEDTDAQSKILLLLHKSLVPVEKDDPLGETERKKKD